VLEKKYFEIQQEKKDLEVQKEAVLA